MISFKNRFALTLLVFVGCAAPVHINAVAPVNPTNYVEFFHKNVQDGFFKAIFELSKEATKNGTYYAFGKIKDMYGYIISKISDRKPTVMPVHVPKSKQVEFLAAKIMKLRKNEPYIIVYNGDDNIQVTSIK